MSERQPLLIELGCEELPARQLDDQVNALADGLEQRLAEAGLIESDTSVERFATPRRLAVRIDRVLARQPDRRIERKGPAEAVAFDVDGQPTRAAEGFARSVGRRVEELERLETDQGRWLLATINETGRCLSELLPDMLARTAAEMAGARSMRWSDRSDRFLRPVRWVVCLHGNEVVPVSLFGLTAGRFTQGHRQHAPGDQSIPSATAYESVLEKAYVLASPKARVERIRRQIDAIASQADLEPVLPSALLEENAGLTEWPVAIIGSFDEAFLSVPEEALICSMQQYQKCFALRRDNAALANRFIAIANIESRDAAAMRAGFERVIRPRLADARFFFEQDSRLDLERARERLDGILFQEKLGSIGDKVHRLEALVERLAPALGADTAVCRRAASLGKTDLVSDMVGEFPELQGTMGRHYALIHGESEAVAAAVESHYQPRHAADALPADAAGQVLALADRLDTVVGIFAAGKAPKSGKDPFALRRAALGIVRLMEHNGTALTLSEAIEATAEVFRDRLEVSGEDLESIEAFILERLRSHAADAGLATNTVHAVSAGKTGSVADFMARARAIDAFANTSAGASLIAANKRTSNLLRQIEEETITDVDVDLLHEEAERALFDAMMSIEGRLREALEAADYTRALTALAELHEPVDRFFDQVMVLCDEAEIRANRLALLDRLKGQIADIADLARLGR
ncbi:MAG: glycine--tRNA ligase subunit beta [Wenzhouxiangella sp.]|jgi:glycyl-tRNA synthetase beta chain|nr:glycine--tRNA ligase subunit beta [Wenzhouxiangella sp.]